MSLDSESAGPSSSEPPPLPPHTAGYGSDAETLNEEEEDEDMVTQVNRFFAELSTDQGRKKRRLIESGSALPRRKSVLPPHLSQVMGNANLRLATGDRAGAIELCMEIIRQAPHASEPYLALATVYEDLGYDEKLLGILMIASHLKRSDWDMWVKTGNLAIKLKDFRIAIHCISKALRLTPNDIGLFWQKVTLHSELNEPKKALETLQSMLKVLPDSNKAEYLEVTKEMARLHHSLEETPEAISLLSKLIASHPALVDEEVINLLAELCILTKAYEQAYEVITDYYGMITQHLDKDLSLLATPSNTTPFLSLTATLRMSIAGDDVEGTVSDESHLSPIQGQFHVPEEVPVDLRVKLAVAMIFLGHSLPDELLQPIFQNPDEYGDLFLDVTDALTECGEHGQALPLLTALVHTRKYSQAGVWLKLAECQHMLGDLEASAMAYSKVISLAPNHTESRLKLATLYVQLGQPDDALTLLEAEPGGGEGVGYHSDSAVSDFDPRSDTDTRDKSTQDTRVVLHRFNLYQSKGDVSSYSKAGKTLLAFLFRDFYYRPEVKEMTQLKKMKVKLGMDPEKGKTSSELKREEKEIEALLSVDEWYQTFVTTCKGLLSLGPANHPSIIHLIYCACLSKKFSSSELNKRFLFFCVSMAMVVHDYGTVFFLLKLLGNSYPDCKHVWNVMNTLPLDNKVYKYILRFCFRHQSNPYLTRILSAHNHASGHYKFALCQYVANYNAEENEAGDKYLLGLCIAVVFINMACQARTSTAGKNSTITQAAAFLHKYIKLRGECQETNYNMGRAFHQLGILHMACHFYKKVLSMEPECSLPKWKEASDLRGEAGFNLSLIYRASGNAQLALHILRTYCTI